MSEKVRNIVAGVLIAIGFAFLGAGFNENNTENDTVFRLVAAALLVAGLSLFALYVRDHPDLRTPKGLLGLAAALVGAALMVTTEGMWNWIGIAALLGGVSSLAEFSTADDATKGDGSLPGEASNT